MFQQFWNYFLIQSATGCMWLALHLECWRVGHDWQAVGPNYAWCEHCEDQSKGECARIIFEAKYGPYVEPPPREPRPMPTIDPDVPSDSLYFINLSKVGVSDEIDSSHSFAAMLAEEQQREADRQAAETGRIREAEARKREEEARQRELAAAMVQDAEERKRMEAEAQRREEDVVEICQRVNSVHHNLKITKAPNGTMILG